ncbi:MAG: hypothetical protein FWG38_05645, partial [Defluviitaleaceae bacterium]|nr:hypothetical protein [Defluviitaleaceae bacterium]
MIEFQAILGLWHCIRLRIKSNSFDVDEPEVPWFSRFQFRHNSIASIDTACSTRVKQSSDFTALTTFWQASCQYGILPQKIKKTGQPSQLPVFLLA